MWWVGVSRVAGDIGVDEATADKIVAEAVRLGLVMVERQHSVCLTEEGRQAVSGAGRPR